MSVTSTINDDVINRCRVCLEKSSRLYPLEGQILNVDVYISTMITYCTSIEVVVEEDLPKGVCLPCFKIIRIAYNFIKQFKETNQRLMANRAISIRDCLIDNQDFNHIKEEPDNDEVYTEEVNSHLKSDDQCSNTAEQITIINCGNNDDDNGSNNHISSEREIASENSDEDLKKIVCIIDENTKKQFTENKIIFLNRHKCPVCSNIFSNFKRGLIKHIHNSHHNESFKCNMCSLEDTLNADLYYLHYVNSHLYQCPICNKRFRTEGSFHCHSRIHTDPRSYECPHENCKKTFATRFRLRTHLSTHSNAAKYVCSKCGKNFNTYDTFRYHNKTHDGKRSHLCNVCGRSFLQSVHLKYHMWHHTGIKQFRCNDCDKSYTSVTQLKKHRRKYCGAKEASL